MLWQNASHYTKIRYPISTNIFKITIKGIWLLVFALLKFTIHRNIYAMENKLCPYYGICGSCKLYQSPYQEQLIYKKKKVIQVFEKLNRSLQKDIEHQYEIFDINKINIPIAAPELYRYRNKMEFTFFKKENGDIGIGYHEGGQYNKFVDIADCLLMKEENATIIKLTKEWAINNKIDPYQKKSHTGILRYLMIRNSFKTKDIIVTLITSGGDEKMFQPLITSLLNNNIQLKGFVWAKHSDFADVAALNDSTLLYGEDALIDSIGDKNFRIPFDSFFQVNNKAATLLYDKILSYVKDKDNVIDLFCGAGTISTYIANKVNSILGIEIVKSAIGQAKANLKLNNITEDKAEFIAGTVREELSKIRFENDYNLVILDPPRSGADKHTMRHIGKRQPDRIVYVACGLDELAFNLKSVMEFGYKVVEVSSIDMFPWTPHVEVIVYLEKV